MCLPSYQEADNIAHPTRVAADGLLEHFPNRPGVIINADNASSDGTGDVFLATRTDVPKIYVSTPPGVRGNLLGPYLIPYKKVRKFQF